MAVPVIALGSRAGCCAQLAVPSAAIKAITERAVLRSFLLMVNFLQCAIGHRGRTIELRASMSRLVSDSNATTEIARICRSDRGPVVIISSDQESAEARRQPTARSRFSKLKSTSSDPRANVSDAEPAGSGHDLQIKRRLVVLRHSDRGRDAGAARAIRNSHSGAGPQHGRSQFRTSDSGWASTLAIAFDLLPG